jgi:hypothetical protein
MAVDKETGELLGWKPGIVDYKTWEQLIEDPRLGPLPEGWKMRLDSPFEQSFIKPEDIVGEGDRPETGSDPRPTVEALRRRGVAIQQFELV